MDRVSDKIEKLRLKLEDSQQKRDKLTTAIGKLQKQIAEEEGKEFRSVMEEMNLSFEEAVHLLKKGNTEAAFQKADSEGEATESNQIEKENNYGSI